MTDSIDALEDRWKKSQDADTTIQLCEALSAQRTTLVQQVADFAQLKYASNVPVLVAVARMYMRTNKLAEAQSVLVAAGKIAPRDGLVYRTLGEVLLRRGDADRAEKVLERAMQFGLVDDATKTWIERARVFKPMQTKAGSRAVAAEIARAAPVEAVPAKEEFEDVETEVRLQNVPVAPVPATRKYPMNAPTIDPFPLRTDLPPLGAREPPARPLERRPKSQAPPPLPPPEIEMTATARNPSPLSPRQPAPFDGAAAGGAARATANGPAIREAHEARSAPVELARNVVVDTRDGEGASPFRAAAPPPDVPDARDVLDALALAGVYESAPTAALKWDRAPKSKRRGTLPLVAITLLFVGGGIRGFRYIQSERAKAHIEAEGILGQIETDMQKSQAALLPPMEQQFSKVFDLDSRSARVALDWLRERALSGLLRGGADVAFEDALTRAQELEVKEESLVFAHIASFLFQGDTVGAAGAPARSGTTRAARMTLGTSSWRAPRSSAPATRAPSDRYEAATKLDAQSRHRAGRARAGDGHRWRPRRRRWSSRRRSERSAPDRTEGPALVALAWARDPRREEQAPPEVEDASANARATFRSGLRFVRHAVAALARDRQARLGDARKPTWRRGSPWRRPGVGVVARDHRARDGRRGARAKGGARGGAFSAVVSAGARARGARGAPRRPARRSAQGDRGARRDVARRGRRARGDRVRAGRRDGLARALDAIPAEAQKSRSSKRSTLGQVALAGRTKLGPDKILDLSDDEAPWATSSRWISRSTGATSRPLEDRRQVEGHREPAPPRAPPLAPRAVAEPPR